MSTTTYDLRRPKKKKSLRNSAGIGLVIMSIHSLIIPIEGIIGVNIVLSPLLLLGGIWFMQGPLTEIREFLEMMFTIIIENPLSSLFIGGTLLLNLLLAIWTFAAGILVMSLDDSKKKSFPTAFMITTISIIFVPFIIEEINWTVVALFGMLMTAFEGSMIDSCFFTWIIGLVFNVLVRCVTLLIDIFPIISSVKCSKQLIKSAKTDQHYGTLSKNSV